MLFLLEANPGPGLGLLLAYMLFGRGVAKASAPGAAIIQFFGGIHEVYFPYVLMKPKLILAMIAGGMTGVFLNSTVFDVGLRAPAAPGSIFAVYAQTPGGRLPRRHAVGVFGAPLCQLPGGRPPAQDGDRSTDEGDLDAATAQMEDMKGKKSIASSLVAAHGSDPARSSSPATPAWAPPRWVPRCSARRSRPPGHGEVTVVNKAIANLDDNYDVVVTHQDLTDRAKAATPSAVHVSVDNFMGSPKYDEIVELIDQSSTGSGGGAHAEESAALDAGVLSAQSIVLGGTATNRDAAITEAGDLLVAAGAVDPSYVDAMHEREKSVSTAMGNGLAIPTAPTRRRG